jgi:hypothetical protein
MPWGVAVSGGAPCRATRLARRVVAAGWLTWTTGIDVSAVSGDLGLRRRTRGSRVGMLAILAAIVFGVAFVINATGRATDRVFSVTGLLLLGLTLLALHQAGLGSVWVRRR